MIRLVRVADDAPELSYADLNVIRTALRALIDKNERDIAFWDTSSAVAKHCHEDIASAKRVLNALF